MNIAHLDQPASTKPQISQDCAPRLMRNGRWIALGVIVPLGIWMMFAVLCVTIVADLNADFDNEKGRAMATATQEEQ